MGIELNNMRQIFDALKSAPALGTNRLLILGDAHIHFSVQQYVELASQVGYSLRSVPKLLTPDSLGGSLGFATTDTLDVNGKASLTFNLQHEIPADLLGQFDCLIDAGVLFWCFDPGVALKNIFKLVRKHGLLVHITAVSGFYGRCFYNIHPLLFERFYLINGCEYLGASYYARPRQTPLLKRMVERLGLLRSMDDITWSPNIGSVFLHEGNARKLSFGPTLSVPERNVIPNNAVGTFAFRKGEDIEPREPLLT